LEINDANIPEKLPEEVALCLYRVVQEGLRNVARHARASRTEVRLQRLDGGLQVCVRDNGVGFDPTQNRAGTSLGHAGMRQRVALLGGKIDIESTPGRGTAILAWVPLAEAGGLSARNDIVHKVD
jgi:signal transduction histidine kinase